MQVLHYLAVWMALLTLTAVWPAPPAQGPQTQPIKADSEAKLAEPDKQSAEDVPTSPKAAASENPNQSVIDPAVKALLAVANDKDNPLGYIFPPVGERKFLGYRQVPQRYHQETAMVPTYRYETVTVTEPVTKGTQTLMTTTQRMRPVAQIGTHQVPWLVPDPTGPIVRMISVPEWGPGGAEHGPEGWLGNNALALVALLRSGVSPDREPALKILADRLSQYVLAFGIPDSTWDLAWTMVAFDEYPGGVYQSQLQRLSAKLVAGQIADGPGKGLWGPICVNPTMLRNAVSLVFSSQLAMQRQAEAAQERAFIEFNAVSLLGPAFTKATRGLTLPDARQQFGGDFEVAGWPLNLYREETADLESTALAAYALRIATTHMKLPATLDYPHGVSFCTEFSTRDALAAAVIAVAAAQHDDGSWDETVVWQPVDQFRDGGEGQFGPLAVPQELPSLGTPIATAEGCNALEDLLAVLGRIDTAKKVVKKLGKADKPAKTSGRKPKPVTLADPAEYRVQIAKGRRRLLELIAEVSNGPARERALADSRRDARAARARGPARQYGPLPVDPLWGGPLEPYSLLCQLRLESESDTRSNSDNAKRAALEELVASTIQSREATGLWPAAEDYMPWTPSLRERALYMVAPPAKRTRGQYHPADKKNVPQTYVAKAKPGHGGTVRVAVPSGPNAQQSRTANDLQSIRAQIYHDARFWSVDAEQRQRLATAYMLCFLAGTAASPDAPPVAGSDSEKKPAAIDKATPTKEPPP